MRVLGLAAALAVLTGTAHAQPPDVVDACAAVAGIQFDAEVTAEDIEAFPDLEPPRARLTAIDAASGERLGKVACEFEQAAAPFGLSYFECAGTECFITRARLEELQVLLARQGL